MDISVAESSLKIPIIAAIISLAIIGVGIYLVFLLIKALRVYIKKNS